MESTDKQISIFMWNILKITIFYYSMQAYRSNCLLNAEQKKTDLWKCSNFSKSITSYRIRMEYVQG